MKQVRLIKTPSNETYSKVGIGKKIVCCISYSEWSKTRRCFITITFQIWFRICHHESPRKSEMTGIKWNKSAPSLCRRC